VVVVAALIVVHYRRIKRLQIGDRFLLEYHTADDPEYEWSDEEKEKYR